MNFLRKLLGGRPMRFFKFEFTDICTGNRVNKYVDTLGRYWLAESRWSLFRVETRKHHD